jgi:hypothetical protein
MLLAVNIRAAATPQMVNRFFTFIVFPLMVGLLMIFVAGHACCSLIARKFEQGMCHRKKTQFLRWNDNVCCAIDARPSICAAQLLRGIGWIIIVHFRSSGLAGNFFTALQT